MAVVEVDTAAAVVGMEGAEDIAEAVGAAVASGPAVVEVAVFTGAVEVATAWVVAAHTLAVGAASVEVTPVAVARSEVDRVAEVSAREVGAEVSTSALHNNINSAPRDNPVSVNLIGPVAVDAKPMGSTVPR